MSKRQNEHTSDDRASVGIPPKPAIEVLDPPPQPEMPEWQKRALDPAVQQLVSQLMSKPPKPVEPKPPATVPTPEWLARSLSPEVQAAIHEQVYGEPKNYTVSQHKPRPLGTPIHVRVPRLTTLHFPGLTAYLDAAIDAAGIDRTGDGRTRLAMARKFALTTTAGHYLAHAIGAGDHEAVRDSLAGAEQIRKIYRAIASAIEAAEADVRRATGLTDSI